MKRRVEFNPALIPSAPVFHPSDEEFKNPMEYIQKIAPEAELAGICRIKPPPSWRCPFKVNQSTFKFPTRIQKLNSLECTSREERIFMERLRVFWVIFVNILLSL